MGPPPAWTSDSRGRMDAVRSLLRPPSAERRSRAAPAGPVAPAVLSAPQAATRVRARPSSLYGYGRVRASPSFPLSRRRAPEAAGGSGGDGGRERGEIRLGAFGGVADMTLETVNFLIRVLEDRRHELMDGGGFSRAKEAAAPGQEPDQEAWAAGSNIRSDAQDVEDDVQPFERAPASSPRELPRVHSYEALVRLEGILESRHQQLMQEGLGDIMHDRELDLASSLVPMNDIQDEVKRVYSSLHVDAVDVDDEMRRNR